MGSENKPLSKDNTNGQQQEEIQVNKHPRFADAIYIQQNQNPYYEVTLSIGNISVYKFWEERLAQVKKKIRENSLLIAQECNYEQKGICGTAGILKLKFGYYPYILQEQIGNRKVQNLNFEDQQLWFLLYVLIQSASSIHKIGATIGDIRPKNIFINCNGDIAVYNLLTFPEEYTNYQKAIYQKQVTYIPPEGIQDLHAGKQIASYDEKIGQSFSIALTMLDAIFLTNHISIYDQSFSFNQQLLQQSIEKLKNNKINQKLKQILLSMLSIDPQSRITCTQIYEILYPYQKEIFELGQFTIQNQVPIKNLQKIEQSPSKSYGNLSIGSKKNSISKTFSDQKSQPHLEPPLSSQSNNASSFTFSKTQLNPPSFVSSTLADHLHQQRMDQSPSISQSQVNRVSFKQAPRSFNQNISLSYQLHSKQQQPKVSNYTFSTGVRGPSNFQTNIGHLNGNNKQQISELNKITQTPGLSFKTGSLFQKGEGTNLAVGELNLGKTVNKPVGAKQWQQVESTSWQHGPGISGSTQSFNLASNTLDSSNNYSDFLKNIDKQLQESRRLFPDGFK